MRRENPPEAQCTGKKVFETFAHAERAARRSHRGRTRSGQMAYHCHACGKFHVGTSIGSRGAKKLRGIE